MRIGYVFMRFPEPTHTFAASDMETLRREGHTVSAWCLRNTHPQFAERCRVIGVDPLTVVRPPLYDHGLETATANRVATGTSSQSVRWKLVQLIRKHCLLRPKVLVKTLALVGNAERLSRRLLETNPQVVHCFWGHYPALVALAVKLHSPSTAVTIFLGAYDLETRHPLSRVAASRADWVFTHARANLPALAAIGIDTSRVTVAHRGIPLDELNRDAPPQRDSNRVVTVGAVVPSKGHETVLRAVESLYLRHPELKCDVIGSGPHLAHLKAFAETLSARKNIRFLGHLPRQAVMQHMRESRLLVMASTKKSERLPNVIKEGMWAGCGIVTGDTSGIRELVPSPFGEVVHSNSHEAYAAAIDRSLGQEFNAAEVQSRQNWIRQHFSAEVSMQRYLSKWTDLVVDSQVEV